MSSSLDPWFQSVSEADASKLEAPLPTHNLDGLQRHRLPPRLGEPFGGCAGRVDVVIARGTHDHARWLNAWEDFRAEAEEFRELDSKRVLVLAHNTGRGKASGLDLRQNPTKQASLLHVHDGKVTKIVLYWNRDRAFADLGLSPEGDAGDPSG